MALKDIDPSKFKNFTYPSVPNPQSFEYNGYTVTGNKTPIEEKYIDEPKINSLDEATEYDNFVGTIDTPQSYEIQNKAGTYTITGLKGIINPELETLKSKSLIIKTYDEMLSNNEGVFKSFMYTKHNPTFGYQQSPFVLKDFGAGSLSAQPERFSDPEIKGHISLTRGGNFTDSMVTDQIDLLNNTGVLGNFKINQALLQSEAIMKGGVLAGVNVMSSFNLIQFESNFVPGTRVYRHGIVGFPLQRYSEHTPKIGGTIADLAASVAQSVTGDKTGDIDPTIYTSDDLNTTPKLGYLYNKFILRPDTIEATQGFSLTNFIDNLASAMLSDPYPIIPSINVVKSPSLNYSDGGNRVYSEEVKYESQEKTTLEQGDTYKFFSKFAPTIYQTKPYQNDEGLEGHPESKIAETREYNDWMDSDLPRPLEQKIREKNLLDQTPKIPKAVDGINSGLRHSSLSYPALGGKDDDGKGGQIDPGGSKDLTYEKTLRSASELNMTIKEAFGGSGNQRDDLELLNTQSGPKGDEYIKDNKGARDYYQKKVYAIGRQGLVGVGNGNEDDNGLFRGAIKKNQVGSPSYVSDATDKVNLIPYGGRKSKKPEDGMTSEEIHAKAEELDFIPLVFHDVYNKKSLAFRAIVGGVTDTLSPEWTENKYIGRPTQTANYSGVKRSIGFDFQIYPKTKQEFPVLLEKTNYLVGLCYPNLDTNLRQTGPIIQLTLGDILNKQLGYISGLTVTFPKESTWELDPGLRFTKLIDVSVTFDHIGGYIPVSTGKHYGLPWLVGQTYGGGNNKFNNFPNRKGLGAEVPKDGIQDYSPLFKDLGQDQK